ncbi:hypothetical protein COBT_002886, partial [Conglomerata obtusa]
MKLLVTVGSYKFTKLTDKILDSIEKLSKLYTQITIQTGQSSQYTCSIANVFVYDFVDEKTYSTHDIILCHCGTGSILRGLINNKIVITI